MQLDMQSIKWHRHHGATRHGGLRNGFRQLIGYDTLNFMVAQILLLKKLTVFWAFSVNLLSIDVIVRLYTTLVRPIIE